MTHALRIFVGLAMGFVLARLTVVPAESESKPALFI